MTTLEPHARRFGLPLDGNALVCGLARISMINGTGQWSVSTSDAATAKALDRSGFGEVLFRQMSLGRLSLAIQPRELLAVIEAIEPDELPSYGRTGGYRS